MAMTFPFFLFFHIFSLSFHLSSPHSSFLCSLRLLFFTHELGMSSQMTPKGTIAMNLVLCFLFELTQKIKINNSCKLSKPTLTSSV